MFSIFALFSCAQAISMNVEKVRCLYVQSVENSTLTVQFMVSGINPIIEFSLFDPNNMLIEQVSSRDHKVEAPFHFEGKYRLCWKNSDAPKSVQFDIDVSGVDKNYASKQNMIESKTQLNNVDSNIRWIKLFISESFQRESGITKNMRQIFTTMRYSLSIKLILFFTVLGAQIYIIYKSMKGQYQQVI